MKKLFGTDGIRAVAGQSPLDPATVYAVGRALAHHLGQSPRVLLGMDTRESSELDRGHADLRPYPGGASVENAGVITTPAIAYLARMHRFSAGVVISASHNPWQDNGIKLFGPDGFKLPDATEIAIEEEIFRQIEDRLWPQQTGLLGARSQRGRPGREEYIRFLLDTVPDLSLAGKRIVVDCANGAASGVAPKLFPS